MTITGTGLDSSTAVTVQFNGTYVMTSPNPCKTDSNGNLSSSYHCTFSVPTAAAAGSYNVTVTDSAPHTATFTVITPTSTPIKTNTPIPTNTNTPLPPNTLTATVSATYTAVPSNTATNTAIATVTQTAVATTTTTSTMTLIPSATATPTMTPMPSLTATSSVTQTPTTMGCAATATPTLTATDTPTATQTATATNTPVLTASPTIACTTTATETATAAETQTGTSTPTATPTPNIVSITLSTSNLTFGNCSGGNNPASQPNTMGFPNAQCTSGSVTVTLSGSASSVSINGTDAAPIDDGPSWTLCGVNPACTNGSPGVDQYSMQSVDSANQAAYTNLGHGAACDAAFGCGGNVGVASKTEYFQLTGPASSTDNSGSFSTTITWTADP